MKKRPLSKKLFLIYSLLFSIVFLAYHLILTRYMALDINNRVITTQKQMRYNITANIENYFKDMDEFSRTLVISKKFKKSILKDIPEKYKSKKSYSVELGEVYQEIAPMFTKKYKVGVYDFFGFYFWMGNDFIFGKIEPRPDLYDSYPQNGEMKIRRVEENAPLREITDTPEKYGADQMISIERMISINSYFNNPQAVLEVRASAEEFDQFIEDMLLNSNITNMDIGVFNKQGESLYNKSELDISAYMKDGQLAAQEVQNRDALVKVEGIRNSNIYLMTVIPNTSYHMNISNLIQYMIIGGSILMACMYLITYLVSRRLSKPIKKMCQVIEKIDMREESLQGLEESSDILEIDILRSTIFKLHGNLRKSMEEIVTLKEYELQSIYMALEAQIQPHFLYNTLTNISALADKGECEKIIRMSDALTKMLRFIAQKDQGDNCICDEIEYLESYMEIMKTRFSQSEIEYDVDLDVSLIAVPKLIVQPLVENAFKYAGVAPLKMSVKGYRTGDTWYIEVSDNGFGFSEESIADIRKRCENLEKNKEEMFADIDGLGMVNIYARLYIRYKERAVFEIENHNGARIRIGGSIS